MQSLIDNARNFPKWAADRHADLGRLASGQDPEALFITCSDSRVVPALLTGARPGDLFELRTAGNIVPVHDAGRSSSEAATIEFAVETLGVRNIIVCGHSHCGAVTALIRPEIPAPAELRRWLADTGPHEDTRQAADPADGDAVTSAVQRHVLAQMDRLREHPCVAERLEDGRLRVHGWFYEVNTGMVRVHQPSTGKFVPL
jgi:carbonic anhydrase